MSDTDFVKVEEIKQILENELVAITVGDLNVDGYNEISGIDDAANAIMEYLLKVIPVTNEQKE